MTSSETRAPEWDQGMGLTWSGRWHVITGSNSAHRYEETKCGAYVERFGSKYFPNHLWAIAEGKKSAPVCKKCVPPERAAAVRARIVEVFVEACRDTHPVYSVFDRRDAVAAANVFLDRHPHIIEGWPTE